MLLFKFRSIKSRCQSFSESDVFDDLNSVLRSLFGFPCSVTADAGPVGADVTDDSMEWSAVDVLPGFYTFTRYVRGSAGRGNEFSRLEDCLKHIESHGPEAGTPEPRYTSTICIVDLKD